MSNYWIDRLDEVNRQQFNKTEEELTATIIKLYKHALMGLKGDIRKLYAEIKANGSINITELYRNDFYYKLASKLNYELIRLGEKEIEVYEKSFLDFYKKEQQVIGEIAPKPFSVGEVGIGRAEEVVNQLWTSDGKYWSDRVWGHKEGLEERLMDTLTDCVSRGLGVDKVVGYLADDFNVSVNQARRLVRTELSRIQNQSALDRYAASGLEYYEIIGSNDDRLCEGEETCAAKWEIPYKIIEAVPGVNLPPLHVNCRCTIIPVVKGA